MAGLLPAIVASQSSCHPLPIISILRRCHHRPSLAFFQWSTIAGLLSMIHHHCRSPPMLSPHPSWEVALPTSPIIFSCHLHRHYFCLPVQRRCLLPILPIQYPLQHGPWQGGLVYIMVHDWNGFSCKGERSGDGWIQIQWWIFNPPERRLWPWSAILLAPINRPKTI